MSSRTQKKDVRSVADKRARPLARPPAAPERHRSGATRLRGQGPRRALMLSLRQPSSSGWSRRSSSSKRQVSVVSREVGAGGSQVHKGMAAASLQSSEALVSCAREERTAHHTARASVNVSEVPQRPRRARRLHLILPPGCERQRDEDLDTASRRNIATEQEFQIRSREQHGRTALARHGGSLAIHTQAQVHHGSRLHVRSRAAQAVVHGREAPTMFDTCTHTHRHRVGHMTLSAAAATRRKPWAAPGTYSLKRRLRHTPCAVHALCSANAPGA